MSNTLNENDLVHKYIAQSPNKLLTAEEEIEFGTIIQKAIKDFKSPYYSLCTTDKDVSKLAEKSLTNQEISKLKEENPSFKKAYDTMVIHNQRLVIRRARKLQDRGLELLDLIQEGNFGLMKAVQKFKPKTGKFSTYATIHVDGAIRQALYTKTQTIKTSVDIHHVFREVSNTVKSFKQREIYNPTTQQIAEQTGLKPKRIDEVQRAMLDTRSLDIPTNDDNSTTLHDSIPSLECESNPEKYYEQQLVIKETDEVLSQLSQNHRDILTKIYKEGMTQQIIADGRQTSKQNIHQSIPFAEKNFIREASAMPNIQSVLQKEKSSNDDQYIENAPIPAYA